MLASHLSVVRTGPTVFNITADPTRVAQMLSNLLDNARRCTPAGGAINIDLRKRDDADTVEVTVTDTGPGVPNDERDHIFERLVRLDPAAPATTAAPAWDSQ
jgi:two-component system OmpR family sensor kinase